MVHLSLMHPTNLPYCLKQTALRGNGPPVQTGQGSFLYGSGLAQFFHCYVPYLKMCGQVQTYPPVSKRGYLVVMPDVAQTHPFLEGPIGAGDTRRPN